FLRHRPELVVDGIAIGPLGQWRDGNEGTDKAELLDPFELAAALVDVVEIEHRDALEARRIGLAEIGDPVVVDAADLRQERAVRHAVPEEALARLQNRAPDAVLLVLTQHRIGGVGALTHILPETEEIDLRGIVEALSGLHDGAQGADLHTVENPG